MISTDVIPILDVSSENNTGLMIPSIQRNYKWGPGHSENDELNSAAYVFLEDMIDFFNLRKSEEDIYFTGTLIVFEEEGEERTQLMDGQQRWTTITVLMGTIRHLLRSNKGNYHDIISEIDDKFLRLNDGSCFLQSKRLSDRKSIEFVVNIEPSDNIKDTPQTKRNQFSFKRDEVNYIGTSINCVIEYFYDRLCKVFGVRGSNSDLTKLADFYKVISRKVFVNYTHTQSPILAYKMFVTANSRGTPLNNFDVFRGLVLAHNRINDYGDEKDLQYDLEDADLTLQDLFSGAKDYGKAVDKVMSDAMTVLQGEKISSNHVMSRLEHTISQFDSRKKLDDLVKFFDDYFVQLQRIENHQGKVGRVYNLRMRYFKFQQHIQYYAAARVFWGEKSNAITDLMNVLETIVIRRLVLFGKNVSKLFYHVSPKHFALIREAGVDENKQNECVEKIRKEFEKSNENPSDYEILTSIKTRTFNVTKNSERNKLLIALLCLEKSQKYSSWMFSTNQGNPKLTYYMPRFDGTDRGYTYPKEYYKREDCHQYIGNCFLLIPGMTQREIDKLPQEKTKRNMSIHNKGKEFSASYQNVLYTNWGEHEIDARSNNLAKLLIERFPRKCKFN